MTDWLVVLPIDCMPSSIQHQNALVILKLPTKFILLLQFHVQANIASCVSGALQLLTKIFLSKVGRK